MLNLIRMMIVDVSFFHTIKTMMNRFGFKNLFDFSQKATNEVMYVILCREQ